MECACLLRVLALCLTVVVFASAEGLNINATIGDDITLPCKAWGLFPVEVVEWSKPEPHLVYVLVYKKENNPQLNIPEQRYKDRVKLNSSTQMENGDVSLFLRNVKAEDNGTYECYVIREAKRGKRAIKPVRTINLHVVPPPPPGSMDGSREDGEKEGGGNQDGSAFGRGHIMAACAVMLVLAAMAVMAAISWKKINKSISSPSDEAEKPEMI